MPRAPKAGEKPAEQPDPQTEAPDPQSAAPEEPRAATRPRQTQQTSAEGRIVEGQVPKIELFIPQSITAAALADLNVHQRWSRCIGEIGLVPKRGWNDHHKYWYTTDADLNAFIGPLFNKYHLVVAPSVTGVERIALEGKQQLTRVLLHIAIINADKPTDRIEVDWIGEGGDTVDKGAYKAFTGGLKYFYMKMLQVATGDDPELFVRTDQLGDLAATAAVAEGPRSTRPVNVRSSTARQPEKGGHQLEVTAVQLRQISAMSQALGYGVRGTAETFDRVLGTAIFDTIDGMDSDEESSRVLTAWIKQQTGSDVGKVLHEMGEEIANRQKAESEPAAEAEAQETEAELLAQAGSEGYGG